MSKKKLKKNRPLYTLQFSVNWNIPTLTDIK